MFIISEWKSTFGSWGKKTTTKIGKEGKGLKLFGSKGERKLKFLSNIVLK